MSKNRIVNILLVEDDMRDCKIIKEYADTRDDVKLVKIANSSKEAIKDIKTYVPDAIILDIELNNGEGSGLQVLEQIKELDLDIKPVIVITTNISSKTVYAYAHSNGADLKSVPLNLHALSYHKRFSHRNYRSHDFFYTYSYLPYRDMN